MNIRTLPTHVVVDAVSLEKIECSHYVQINRNQRKDTMNYQAIAFEQNHKALLRIVAALFVAVGLVVGGPAVTSIPRCVRTRVLRVLRPAEAALRRLIAIAARDVVIKVRDKCKRSTQPSRKGSGSGARAPMFPLFDPRKWFWELAKSRRSAKGPGPRISGFDDDSWTAYEPEEPSVREPDPLQLCRRLMALKNALDDIPAQARRLARLQHRRRAAGEPLKRTEPIRPGTPPGYRKHWEHEVDEILVDCHRIFLRDPVPPDRC